MSSAIVLRGRWINPKLFLNSPSNTNNSTLTRRCVMREVLALLEAIRPHVIRYMASEYSTVLVTMMIPNGKRKPKYSASSRTQQLKKTWRLQRGHDLPNQGQPDCFFNKLFKLSTKEISKLDITGLVWEFTGDRWLPSQSVSKAGSVSMSWRYHGMYVFRVTLLLVSKLLSFQGKIPSWNDNQDFNTYKLLLSNVCLWFRFRTWCHYYRLWRKL